MHLVNVLPSSKRCAHLKGHSGAKQTVNSIHQISQQHEFVFRTDVKSHYESIDHYIGETSHIYQRQKPVKYFDKTPKTQC